VTDAAPVDAWSADLPPLAELVASLGDIDEEADPDDQVVDSMDIDQITLTLAIELEVRDADTERPRVTGSTPTQWTETTVLPVFHRLSMRVARAPDG
jgi:hypothetical protein